MSLERLDVTSESSNSEEDQILESISRLRVEIDRIEATTGPSKRTHCIRDEIKRLGSRLAYCKVQAREPTAPVPQEKAREPTAPVSQDKAREPTAPVPQEKA